MRPRAKTLIELSAVAAALVPSLFLPFRASEPNDFPTTGEAPPKQLRWLDSHARTLIRRWDIPGGAIAVCKDGKIIFSRGYGYADVANERPVLPEKTLFRIASVSKPITAAAVLKLEEEGKLDIDDRIFDLLSSVPADGARLDKRLQDITVRDLLNMSAGWDKEISGDPILQPYIHRAAQRMHQPGPADFDTTFRYMLTRKLDFTPGTRFAYSNFTYGILGKIIERQSGEDYESYVRSRLFNPCGVQLYRAHTRQQDRLPNEVVYYAPLEPESRPILPCGKRKVAAPYGRAYLESDLPILGWAASAPELAVLMDRLLSDNRLLRDTQREKIVTRPDLACWRGKQKYFSMGWEISRDKNGNYTLFKDGTLPGTRAFVQRTRDGITWVALFNARPPQRKPDKFENQIKELMSEGLSGLSTGFLFSPRQAEHTNTENGQDKPPDNVQVKDITGKHHDIRLRESISDKNEPVKDEKVSDRQS